MKNSRKIHYIITILLVFGIMGISGCASKKYDPQKGIFDMPKDTEEQYMYIEAMELIGGDVAQAVPFSKNHKVWVTNLVGGRNADDFYNAYTVDALTHALLVNNKCAPLEKDIDMVRDMYVEYTEARYLDPKSSNLVKMGKLLDADYILSFRIIKLEVLPFNLLQTGAQLYAKIATLGLLKTHRHGMMILGIHLRATNVRTGEVVWSGYFQKDVSNTVFKNLLRETD